MQDSRFYWNDKVKPKIVKELDKEESTFLSVGTKRNFTKSSLAAAVLTGTGNPQSVLNRKQLEQCGNAYINNGIVRTVIDKTVYFINGERSSFVIEPNDELTEGLDDAEVRKLQDKLKNDASIKELRRKLVRVNKRVEFNQACTQLLTSTFVFGRGGLEISRFPKSNEEVEDNGNWPIFGEPKGLRHLTSLNIKEVTKDSNDKLKTFEYEQDMGKTKSIPINNLIPAFNDDNNIINNTNFSGLSAVWPILEAAHVMEAIIAEDMPEITRIAHSKQGIMYAGTSKKSTLRKLREELEAGTWLVHNEENLKAEVFDTSIDPMKLMEVVDALARYTCMSASLPMFLLFEDTANFATANQVMQVYKAGMLKRHRTWFQGILEKYWYDPMLADHLKIELKDVISADIKIKAIFPDINFETRKEILEGDQIAANLGVLNKVDIAKDISREDIIPRLELEMVQEVEEEQLINDSIQRQREESIKGQQIGNKVALQNGEQPRKQSPVPSE